MTIENAEKIKDFCKSWFEKSLRTTLTVRENLLKSLDDIFEKWDDGEYCDHYSFFEINSDWDWSCWWDNFEHEENPFYLTSERQKQLFSMGLRIAIGIFIDSNGGGVVGYNISHISKAFDGNIPIFFKEKYEIEDWSNLNQPIWL